MRPLHFTIIGDIEDCYIYGGNVFMALGDGALAFISLNRIIQILAVRYPQYKAILELAFLRNDYWNSTIGTAFLEVPDVNLALRYAWHSASENTDFIITWDEIASDVKIFDNISSPLLDMRLYAMNLYVGTEEGMYESRLTPNDYSIEPTKLEKKFDAKVIGLNAGFGSVIISAGKEGLFSGDINENNHIHVNERGHSGKSYRTGWTSHNLINYEEQNKFEYLENATVRTEFNVGYSTTENKGSKEKLVSIGNKRYSMEKLLGKKRVDENEILFSFNSSQSSFLYTKDGIKVINLLKNRDTEDIYLSSRAREKYKIDKKTIEKPISASVVPAGCVVEFFDNVQLYQNNKIFNLEKVPTYTVRSYMSSLRYRYLVTAAKSNALTVHSLQPFDTYRYQPPRNLDNGRSYAKVADELNDFDLPF